MEVDYVLKGLTFVEYDSLKFKGMLYELHPTATGDWDKDCWNKGKEPHMTSSDNNGGSTDYYKIPHEFKDIQDVFQANNLNYAQGTMLKVAWTFNVGRHDATNYERELNKIIFFAQRELDRL